MKRSFKKLQDRLDMRVLASITAGNCTHAQCKQLIRTLFFGGTENFGELLTHAIERLCGSEASASKQRLEKAGLIYIGKGNKAILAENVTPDDMEFIINREESTDLGRLKSRAVQCYQAGMLDGFNRYLQAIQQLDADAAGEVQTAIQEIENQA